MATDAEIIAAYQKMGRTNIDAEGYNYWKNQPASVLNGTVDAIMSGTAQGAEQTKAKAAAIDPGYAVANQIQPQDDTSSQENTVPLDSKSIFTSLINNKINTAQANGPMVFKSIDEGSEPAPLTPAPGTTLQSELAKWRNMDASIDPAWAQSFQIMQNYYKQGQFDPGSALAIPEVVSQYQAQKEKDNAPSGFDSLMQGAITAGLLGAVGAGIGSATGLLDLGAVPGASTTTGAAVGGSVLPEVGTSLLGPATGSIAPGLSGVSEIGATSLGPGAGTLTANTLGVGGAAVGSNLLAPATTAASGTIPAAASSGTVPVAATGSAIGNAVGNAVGNAAGNVLGTGLSGSALAALAGGVLGATGGTEQAGTTTTTQVPWEAQQPYLTDLWAKSQAQGNNSTDLTLTPYANSTIQGILTQDPTKGYGMNLVNPEYGKTTAQATNPYLYTENPYLQTSIDKATGDITRNMGTLINGANRRSGSFGNSGVAEEYGRQTAQALGDTTNSMRMADYTNRQNLTQDLSKYNSSLNANDLSRNSSLWGADQTRNLGAYQTNQNNMLTAATNVPTYQTNQQNAIWAPLKNYSSLVSGQAGSQTTLPYFTNPTAGLLGGALTGAQIYGLLGNMGAKT